MLWHNLVKLCLHENAKICIHSRNFLVTFGITHLWNTFFVISESLITWIYAKRVPELYTKYASYAV